MNYKKITLLSISILFLYCKKEIPISFSSENFSEKTLDHCKNVTCPEITVNYIEAIGNKVISEKINSNIKQFIIDALYLGDDEQSPKAITIKEAATHFIDMYRTHSAEFPDMTSEYFAEITVTESYSAPTIYSLETRTYLYTGGAHGYGATHFMNIDPKTGEELTTEDLVKKGEAFTVFAEKIFREANNIPKNESINSTGFWFENDTFQLPKTIGFTNKSIVLLYSPYDIASYAEGPIELEIPLKEAAPYLTIK